MRTREKGAHINANVCLYISQMLSYPDPQKKKGYRNGQELWSKVEKNQELYEKTIIAFKGRAPKFHKSSITFWVKTDTQPKNKQKSSITL